MGRQLEDAREKFSAGLLYYSNSARGDKPAAVKSALPAAQKELVAKIAKMIVSSSSSFWDIFGGSRFCIVTSCLQACLRYFCSCVLLSSQNVSIVEEVRRDSIMSILKISVR